MHEKIIIFGGSSFIGRVFLQTYYNLDVKGTYSKSSFAHGVRFNLLIHNLNVLDQLLTECTAAVILLGDTQPDSCFKEKEQSYNLNVIKTKELIRYLQEKNIFTIFTSTEFVFDGGKGLYKEEDEANPILIYGYHKKEIELYIIKNYTNYCILRLGKVYGENTGDGSIFCEWKLKLENNLQIVCAEDQYFSPVFVGDVVKIIRLVCKIRLKGIYHLSCGVRYSRIELLRSYHQYLKSESIIQGVSIDSFDLPEKRPKDVSLNSQKIQNSINYKFSNIFESFERIK